MERGESYFSRGDFAHASVEFRNALQIQPNNSTARLRAGEAAEKLGKIRDAFGLYQSAVDAAPDRADARADLARLLVLAGAADRALTVIEPGLARHPDDAALLTYRAAARMQQNNEAGAVADADRALQLAPLNEEAIGVRAGLYRRTGDLQDAKTLVTGVLGKLPDSVNLRQILADLCELSGDATGAERPLRELTRLRPTELTHRERLALFYVHAQPPRLEDAQRVLEEAVSAMPASDEAKLALVNFLTTQRGRAEGEKALRAFIARQPDDYDLRLGLGELLQRSADSAGAARVYNEVIERDGTGPKGLLARDRLAGMAFDGGRYEEARGLIRQVLDKNPADSEALGMRARIALLKNDPASAIADFRAVLRDQPQSVGTRRLLARAYVANAEPALAEEALRAALELAPADSQLRLELAQVLLGAHRPAEGVTVLEQGVHDAPTDATIRQALAGAYLATRDFAAAGRAAQDLETLRPKGAAAPYLAGLAAEGQKQPDEALRQFERAHALEPGNFEALSALAMLHQQRGEGTKAVAVVKSASDRDPANGALLNLLGQLYLANHNLTLADSTLTRATAAAPKWWVPYRNLALAKIAEKDVPGTIAAYRAGINAAPAEPQPSLELSLFYEKRGRPDDAIAVYEALYRADPRAQAVANDLAMLLVRYKQDRASLDRARDLTAGFAASKNGNFLDTNGWVHFKRAEYDQALQALQRASELEPNSREIRGHLGLAELHAGQAERARRDLETAVSGSASFSGIEEARTALAALKPGAG